MAHIFNTIRIRLRCNFCNGTGSDPSGHAWCEPCDGTGLVPMDFGD